MIQRVFRALQALLRWVWRPDVDLPSATEFVPMIGSTTMAEMRAQNERVMDEASSGRCESRLHKGSRSWRCVNDAGHPPAVVRGKLEGGHNASDRSGRHW